MSFKILAIRPLKGISVDLLKGLKINQLYRFYNEYTFFNSKGEDLNWDINGKGHDIEITQVAYNKKIPFDFYGENYSVSAIVGENGSGKSSLLELYYYFVLILSDYNGIVTLSDTSKKEIINCEVYLQQYDDEQKKVKINKIVLESKNFNTPHKINVEYAIIDLDSDTVNNRERFQASKKTNLRIYNCVLNYSLYGLNSITLPWVEDIFYRNDGYQTPIVINPFRDQGSIAINNEYLLAQARIILYMYVLKQKVFLDNLYIHEFAVKLDIVKYQFSNDSYNDSSVLENFLDCVSMIFDSNEYIEENIKSIIKGMFSIVETNNELVVNEITKSIAEVNKLNKKRIYHSDFNTFSELEKREALKYLCFLYSFKKIQKIARVYKEYLKYGFLFDNSWKKIINWEIRISDISNEVFSKLKQEGVFDNRSLFLQKMILLYIEELINHNLITNQLSEMNKELVLLFKDYIVNYIITITEGVEKNVIDSFEFDSSGEWLEITLSLKNKSYFNYLLHTISLLIQHEYEYNFGGIALQMYLKDLKEDKSHITFKLKQALNYFNIGLFDEVLFVKKGLEKDIKLEIPQHFFTTSNSITDIPIAFFNYDIKVVKTTEEDENERKQLIKDEKLIPYPFRQLSSGEQQSIHTILNVVYHTYNVLSVKEANNNIRYSNISIIFDEIELYLHPEYQRTFIKNLIKVLALFEDSKFEYYNRDLKFNILLSTHSPFILSDIPSENVLKLKEGRPIKHDKINSFGSNIHDLLADEFFLNKGFMGEFAASKIEELFNRIEGYKKENGVDLKILTQETYELLLSEIRLIGEKVLREPLISLLNKRMRESITEKQELINKYKEIIAKLEKEL